MRPGLTTHGHTHRSATCILFRKFGSQCHSSRERVRTSNYLIRIAYFFFAMTPLFIDCTVESRPSPSQDDILHDVQPSSSSAAVGDVNEMSIEQYNSSTEIGELRYNVRQPYSVSTSRIPNHNRDELSSEQIILLPHQQQQQNLTFIEESRRAFQRLDVQPPLLPDEERRRIWLERHHHRKLALHERREQSISHRNRFIGLSSANFTNSINHTCKGDLFKHKVRMAGCEPKIIINRFCHGSCASFYIPKLHTRDLRAQFRSCAACVPSETDLVQIKLDCPGRAESEIVRTVMRVKRCACRNIKMDDYEDADEGVDGMDD